MNRKILLFAFIIGLFAMACNDGDMEVESISFENSDVLSCRANDTAVDFLYKYNQKQALYLTITAGVLENKEKTVTGTIPNNYKLYYRTFSDVVSSSYFCNTIYPASPQITFNSEATGGTVTIATRPIYNENTGALLRYDHQITISNLVLLKEDGNKLVESNLVFGTYQTNKQ